MSGVYVEKTYGSHFSYAGASLHLRVGGVNASSTWGAIGYLMGYAGSVTQVCFVCDVNPWTSGDVDFAVEIRRGTANFDLIESKAVLDVSAAGNAQLVNEYFPVGRYRFRAGDILLVDRRLTGTATTVGIHGHLGIEYDRVGVNRRGRL